MTINRAFESNEYPEIDEYPDQEVYQNDQTRACDDKLCELILKRAEKTLISQEVSSPESIRCYGIFDFK